MSAPKLRHHLFLFLLLPGLPLLAQETPSPVPPEDSFAEEIEVSVVNLDVFVTDRKGEPIPDLRREELEILEDGRPVEITNFYAEGGRQASGRKAEPRPAPRPAPRPDDQRLSLVVFVDDNATAPQNRTRLLAGVRDLLGRQLAAGDQAMVVRYGNSLDIVRPFTADLKQAAADLEGLTRLATGPGRGEAGRDAKLLELFTAAEAFGGWDKSLEGPVQAYAAEETARLAGSLDALESVVGWLAGVPGRKAILYVSDGLPAVPGADLYLLAGIESRNRISTVGMESFDATRRFREVTARASRNRVALYPLEGALVERGNPVFDTRARNLQNGLRFLAEETGGLALLNAADARLALADLADDLSSFYSIGYRPRRRADEREHQVEVRVRRKGAVVRHRRWYRDKTRGETIADRTTAAMLFGLQENPLRVKLEIDEPTPTGDSFVVPVRVRIPTGSLYLEPHPGAPREGKVRLYVVASTEDRSTPVKETRLVTVSVPEAEAASPNPPEYVHEVWIPLPPGSYSVGVGVRDEIATTTSYLRGEFEVGRPAVSAEKKP